MANEFACHQMLTAEVMLSAAGPDSLARGLNCVPLQPDQLLDSLAAQFQQVVHLFARERQPLGGSLDFDETAIAGADDVHVYFGARIFVVFEIEQSRRRQRSRR